MIVKSKQTGQLHKARWIWGNWYAVMYEDEPYMYQVIQFEASFEIVSYE